MKWMMIVVVGLMVLPTSHAWEYKPKSQIKKDQAKAAVKKSKASDKKAVRKYPKKARVAKSKKFRGLRKKGPRILTGVIVGEKRGNIIFRSGFGEYHLNKDAVSLRNKKQIAKVGFRKNRTYSLRVEPGDIKSKALKPRFVQGVTR